MALAPQSFQVPFLQKWGDRVTEALQALGRQPYVLFCVAFALNALSQPYAGIVHDARLYSVQTLNRLSTGAFADDLFLRYGSQDQYSLFSIIVLPVVRVLGLEASFFLLYLIFNAYLVWSYLRLIRALIDAPAVAACASLFVVLVTLPYGGFSIFHVLEPFFTPRLIAMSLVFGALERMLHGRFTIAFVMITFSLAFHPLMAWWGLMVWMGYLAIHVLSRKALLLTTSFASAIGVVVLATPAVGIALFGTMAGDWYEMTRWGNPYLFPGEWSWQDWLDTTVSILAVMAGASVYGWSSQRARFLLVLAYMGVVGLVVAVVAALVPYTLLFQCQAYRILWLIKAMQGPTLILFAIYSWQKNTPTTRCLALVYIGYLCLHNSFAIELSCIAFVFVIAAILVRGLQKQPRYEQWLPDSMAVGGLYGLLGWSVLKLLGLSLIRWPPLAFLDKQDYIRLLLDQGRPLLWLLVAVSGITWWHFRGISKMHLGYIAIVVAMTVQIVVFIFTIHPWLRLHTLRFGPEVAFVQNYFRNHPFPKNMPPTIYAYWGRSDHVWIDLQAKSYFTWEQIAGVVFNRGTAIEGRRRALLVGPFELDRLKEIELLLPLLFRPYFRLLFGAKSVHAHPTRDDLFQLCQDRMVDIVILRQEFPDLAVASNGKTAIYECQLLRSKRSERF